MFPWVGTISRWAERRLTNTGLLLGSLLIGGALFGLDPRQTIAVSIACIALGFLCASALLSVRWRPRLEVQRLVPEMMTVARSSVYFVCITNRGRRRERGLVLRDTLSARSIDYGTFQQRRTALGLQSVGRFDRALGFKAWVWLRRQDSGGKPAYQNVPDISPGQTVRVPIELTCERRGWISFDTIELLRPDPLGLMRAGRRYPTPGRLLSLPQRHPLAVPRFDVRTHDRSIGAFSAAKHIGTQQFSHIRDYRNGDPRKLIHWKSLAKTSSLLVREFHGESTARSALIVDTRLGPRDGLLFEGIVTAAASVLSALFDADMPVTLLVAGHEVLELPPGVSAQSISVALRQLAQVRSRESDSFRLASDALHAGSRVISRIWVIVGRPDAEKNRFLQELRQGGMQVKTLEVIAGPSSDETLNGAENQALTRVRLDALAHDLALARP